MNNSENTPLTDEQAALLLQAAQGDPLEALWVLALTTGMRLRELLGLQWQDLDREQAVIHVRRLSPSLLFSSLSTTFFHEIAPKSQRSIPLDERTWDTLERHRLHQDETRQQAGSAWQDHDLIFCTSLGTILQTGEVLASFSDLVARAGLPDLRFRNLRRNVLARHFQRRS